MVPVSDQNTFQLSPGQIIHGQQVRVVCGYEGFPVILDCSSKHQHPTEAELSDCVSKACELAVVC
jgi:hypothetical protein